MANITYDIRHYQSIAQFYNVTKLMDELLENRNGNGINVLISPYIDSAHNGMRYELSENYTLIISNDVSIFRVLGGNITRIIYVDHNDVDGYMEFMRSVIPTIAARKTDCVIEIHYIRNPDIDILAAKVAK